MFLALKDNRVPWLAKLAVGLVIGYIMLPIDILPEYWPLVGLIDDLFIVTLGISGVMKMIPEPVMEECRKKAGTDTGKLKRILVTLAGLLLVWFGLIIYAIIYLVRQTS